MSQAARPLRVMIGLNTAWNVVNFRAGLVSALRERGFDVVAVTPEDDSVPRLRALGCRHLPLSMQAQGTHPGRDLHVFWQFLRAMRHERPDVYLGYTIKPNIYGSLAARLLGIPVINTVTGLGTAFLREGWVTRIARLLYRVAFARSHCVLFQNDADRALFVDGGLLDAARAGRIAGSGVNLVRFPVRALPDAPGRPFRFLMVSRLLGDKGVREYAAAARLLRARRPDVEVMVMGALDSRNPDAVSRAELESWLKQGVIGWIAPGEGVAEEMARADCIVLPSYREGTPRTLLEAAATGRPLIATDVAGCTEVVKPGVTGLLCKARDALDLARAMEAMALLDAGARAGMAREARALVERTFDERVVVARYLDLIDQAVTARGTARSALPSGAAR